GERYLSLELLRGTQLTPLAYHEHPSDGTPHKRLVEHTAKLFFTDDLSGSRSLGEPSRLGLVFEAYRLATTGPLIDPALAPVAGDARPALDTPGAFTASGFRPGSAIPGVAAVDTWWMRSGVAGFAADAARRFYLPEHYLDPFGHETRLTFDDDDLLLVSSTDA